jgi:uncharacterized RmlC-like cupin family protein
VSFQRAGFARGICVFPAFAGKEIPRFAQGDSKKVFFCSLFSLTYRGVATFRLATHRTGMSELGSRSIRIVHPYEFSEGTSQTPGSQRLAAISPDLGIHSALWGGTFLVEPGAQTGIHHHGLQETIAYVLEGESFIQWGDRGEHSITARAGDFLHVPAWLVHREINRSKDTPFRWVVIRSTSEPIVVNLPEDTW